MQHARKGDEIGYVAQGRMGGHEAHTQARPGEAHADVLAREPCRRGQEFRVAGKIEARRFQHGLVQGCGEQRPAEALAHEAGGQGKRESGGAAALRARLAGGRDEAGKTFRHIQMNARPGRLLGRADEPPERRHPQTRGVQRQRLLRPDEQERDLARPLSASAEDAASYNFV